MFRRLTEAVRKDTEQYLDNRQEAGDFASRLAYRGNALVGSLHGHHGWEDMEYFPELSAADPHFDAGLAILENDHKVLDAILEEFTDSAIQTLGLIDSQDKTARDEAAKVHACASVIEKLLARHLVDEEELAVPIIIHHKLRG